MDIGSTLVGIGGLLVGAYSTYLSYQNRISKFQEKVYEEQLRLIKDYFEKIEYALFGALLIPKVDEIEGTEGVEEFYQGFEKDKGYLQEFILGTYKDVLLPNKIVKLKNQLTKNLYKLISQRNELDKEEKIKLVNKIFDQKSELVQLCRKNFGIEKLSEETLNQISQSTTNKFENLPQNITKIIFST